MAMTRMHVKMAPKPARTKSNRRRETGRDSVKSMEPWNPDVAAYIVWLLMPAPAK